MKEVKRLLELLEKYEGKRDYGLCGYLNKLLNLSLIDFKEYRCLLKWIIDNTPNVYSNYWYNPGDFGSRIEYLKQLAKK